MEVATGPPADLLLKQCGVFSVAPQKPVHVLDLACGGAIVTAKLFAALNSSAQENVKIVCGDLAPGMVELANRRIQAGGWNAEAQVMDMTTTGLTDNSFDYVLINFAVQFLPQYDVVIKEFHRVLKAGGRVSFTAWAETGWRPLMRAAIPTYVDPPLFNSVWTKESFLRDTFPRYGFEDVQVDAVEFVTQVESVAAFMATFKGVMSAVFSGAENAEKLQQFLLDKFGPGEFSLSGWKAICVTATKV